MSTRDLREQLSGYQGELRVWASDAENHPARCSVFSAAKARRGFTAQEWRRRYSDAPFMLKVIRQIIVALHRDRRTTTWEGLQEALQEQMAKRTDLHPGVRKYVAYAVEQYLDAHDVPPLQYEGLKFFSLDPSVGSQGRELVAWALLYSSPDGFREVRRLRVKKARGSMGPEHDRWAAAAAHIAAGVWMEIPPTRIRVVEVGLFDGSAEVVFEGTPEEARARYDTYARPIIQSLVQPVDYRPGQSCKDCKLAGCCPSLHDFSGCLGQKKPGTHTRSVSAADLELYSNCAARWYLEKDCFLPKEDASSEAADRGRIIHRWLAEAHARGGKCAESDVAAYGESGTFTGTLTEEEYGKARDFLIAHARSCPLVDGVEVVSIESPVYGYDRDADVVIASEPDLVYREADGRIVVRETKTTTEMPEDAGETFDRFFAAPWLINIASTANDAFGNSSGRPRIELEVITPDESRTFAWDLEQDAEAARIARADVRRRASTWNRDASWSAAPGAQCTRCPVRRWCPDAADTDGDAGDRLRASDEPCAGLPVDWAE
ncbi:PD-(D/E)XK nuclease family protein [Kitasatospora sp. NPDC048365]|uniref:PD-(D/E)XK nuclease family protein n=1 Tax=Kitasatospora sp. NPDC048365 TaxID=3364050 RepID=UPI00371B8BCD